MKQFEYRFLWYDGDEDSMNQLGADGWEFVGMANHIICGSSFEHNQTDFKNAQKMILKREKYFYYKHE